MDVEDQDLYERPRSHYSYSKEQEHSCSFEKCCCFLLLFIFLFAMLIGATAIIIVFVIRPKKPIFSLQTLRLDSYKLNKSAGSNVIISYMISLIFNAQNPNKVGIEYSPTELCILYRGIPIGLAEVPGFDQPAHSENVTVIIHVTFERLNVSQIINGDFSKDSSGKSFLVIRIIGDVKAHGQILHVTLPKIKIGVDCRINVEFSGIVFRKGINSSNTEEKLLEHLLLSNFPSFSKKCDMAVYI